MTLFPSTEVMRRAQINYRQLDHWVTRGYLMPSKANPGSGSQREFPESELEVAEVMADLVRAGFLPARAERLARGLLHMGSVLLDGGFVISRPNYAEADYSPDGTITRLSLVHNL